MKTREPTPKESATWNEKGRVIWLKCFPPSRRHSANISLCRHSPSLIRGFFFQQRALFQIKPSTVKRNSSSTSSRRTVWCATSRRNATFYTCWQHHDAPCYVDEE